VCCRLISAIVWGKRNSSLIGAQSRSFSSAEEEAKVKVRTARFREPDFGERFAERAYSMSKPACLFARFSYASPAYRESKDKTLGRTLAQLLA